jgi:hypothetical protein
MTDQSTLKTLEQVDDAAANALAALIADCWPRDREGLPRLALTAALLRELLVPISRGLLRGPLDQDWTYRPGGYCMKTPADPGLRALMRYGALLVELCYTARDAAEVIAQAGLPPVSGVGTRGEAWP